MSCSDIKLNEPLKLHDTLTICGEAITSTLTAAFYDYWKPSNATAIKSGTWTADILDGITGEVEYNIPADILDEITEGNKLWRTQLRGTIDGLTYSADAFSFKVVNAGEL